MKVTIKIKKTVFFIVVILTSRSEGRVPFPEENSVCHEFETKLATVSEQIEENQKNIENMQKEILKKLTEELEGIKQTLLADHKRIESSFEKKGKILHIYLG